MDKKQHRDYLAGEWWQKRRRHFLWNHRRCERCGLPRWLASIAYEQDLHVHHKSYQNLGREPDEDLEAICRRCHDVEHTGRSEFHPVRHATCEICGYKHYNIYSETCEKCDAILWQGVPEGANWTAVDTIFSGEPLWQVAVRNIFYRLPDDVSPSLRNVIEEIDEARIGKSGSTNGSDDPRE